MAAVKQWAESAWTDMAELDRERWLAILPVGAVEAHGPHLPLATDGIIAGAMARAAADRLARRGWTVSILPALEYTAAPFADSFPGTISIGRATVTALVAEIGVSLLGQGVRALGIANAHLDPTHLGSLHDAAAILAAAGLDVGFPDLTRKPWALRLGDEFKSGACHAGCFEGSVVLAERPDLVREERRRRLKPNPSSLSVAIGEGKSSFAEAGGPQAYFGDPAAASAEEGRLTRESLGEILEQAVLTAMEDEG